MINDSIVTSIDALIANHEQLWEDSVRVVRPPRVLLFYEAS
jgi:hypothetical protein